jgi:hypothetical protein
MSIRGSSFELISLSLTGVLVLEFDGVTCLEIGFAEEVLTLISLNVFHWWQLGHLPIHFAESNPQLSHTYAVLSFAIAVQKYK